MATSPPAGSAAAPVHALSELFFGDEEAEQLDDTLGRLIAPHFRQRINGKVYGREEYAGQHLRAAGARRADAAAVVESGGAKAPPARTAARRPCTG